MSEASGVAFVRAVGALDQGDVAGLARLLDADPSLVHARSSLEDSPYEGYFYRATLLHHIAGNPFRGELAKNVVSVARLLLERGADVHAGCGGGPAQPETSGGTVLGLVASSANAERAGLCGPLIDPLLEFGAELNGVLWTAMYHTVENQGQRDVAAYLHAKGHEIDCCFAAGLGLAEEVESYFAEDGELVAHADSHYRRIRKAKANSAEVLSDALLFACVQGRLEVAQLLHDRGAELDVLRSWGPFPVTPLHGAAWAGWTSVVGWLLDAGANSSVLDPTYSSSPCGWARSCGRDDVVELFRSRSGER